MVNNYGCPQSCNDGCPQSPGSHPTPNLIASPCEELTANDDQLSFCDTVALRGPRLPAGGFELINEQVQLICKLATKVNEFVVWGQLQIWRADYTVLHAWVRCSGRHEQARACLSGHFEQPLTLNSNQTASRSIRRETSL